MSFSMIFPGQGSQAVGMLAEHVEHASVAQTLAEASDVLGFDVSELMLQGPAETLNQTAFTQPVLLTAGIALYRRWQAENGVSPAVMMGHSLGEYTALVAAGALAFEDGLRVVAKRGELMQQAVPAGVGAMAAVLGLDDDGVMAACQEACENEVVAAVNFNAPGQVVIAGNVAAVERAGVACKAAGAKLVKTLPVSVPSHCALMQGAAEQLAEELSAITVTAPQTPILHNVDAQARTDADAIRQALVQQLHSPVQWVQCVQTAVQQYAVTQQVECGPGKVLTGLTKRIDRAIGLQALHNQAGFSAAMTAIAEL